MKILRRPKPKIPTPMIICRNSKKLCVLILSESYSPSHAQVLISFSILCVLIKVFCKNYYYYKCGWSKSRQYGYFYGGWYHPLLQWRLYDVFVSFLEDFETNTNAEGLPFYMRFNQLFLVDMTLSISKNYIWLAFFHEIQLCLGNWMAFSNIFIMVFVGKLIEGLMGYQISPLIPFFYFFFEQRL